MRPRIMHMVLEEVSMPNHTLRHKHLQIDQGNLDRAKEILGARTETEAVERALKLVVSEADIDASLRKAGRKAQIKRVYR